MQKKLRNRSFLEKIIKSSGKGGTRVPSKNCDFCKKCEKLEKSQVLLKLLNSSAKGGRKVSNKTEISGISPKKRRNLYV